MLCRYCKTVFHNMEKFSGRVKDHPSSAEMVWECRKFLGAVRGGATRPAQGVGVGSANSRGERWVKIYVMQAFREVFNIITIMLSKKQGGRHARDLNGVIPRTVLPKGHKRGAPLRCFVRLAPIRPRRFIGCIQSGCLHNYRPPFPFLRFDAAEPLAFTVVIKSG